MAKECIDHDGTPWWERFLTKSDCKEIRALEEAEGTLSTTGVKIIMITALDDVKDVVQSFKVLCDAYVFKPVDTNELLNHLKTMALVS